MFRSLRAKLLLSHLGLVLLAMVILGGYLVQNMDWFYLDAIRGHARDDAALFVDRIAPILAAGDKEAVKRYLADMGNNVQARVMVTDADGMIVGTTEPEEAQFLGRPGLGLDHGLSDQRTGGSHRLADLRHHGVRAGVVRRGREPRSGVPLLSLTRRRRPLLGSGARFWRI